VSFHIAQASKVLSTPVTIVKMPMIKLTFVSAEMLRGYSAIEVSSWLENIAPRNKLVGFVDGYFLG
jgi:ribosomal protein L3